MKTDWEVFDQNSSSIDSLIDFVEGASLKRSLEGMWCPDAIRELKQAVSKRGLKKTRTNARRWLKSEMRI